MQFFLSRDSDVLVCNSQAVNTGNSLGYILLYSLASLANFFIVF